MFSNCDEESRRKIRKIVFDPELRETVILISHYKEDISEVDAVYELKNGVLSKKINCLKKHIQRLTIYL